jgi:hypothetical protein
MKSKRKRPTLLAAARGSAYQSAWREQEAQWKRLREWDKKVGGGKSLPKRTHLMDFAAGWVAAIRVAYKSVGDLETFELTNQQIANAR